MGGKKQKPSVRRIFRWLGVKRFIPQKVTNKSWDWESLGITGATFFHYESWRNEREPRPPMLKIPYWGDSFRFPRPDESMRFAQTNLTKARHDVGHQPLRAEVGDAAAGRGEHRRGPRRNPSQAFQLAPPKLEPIERSCFWFLFLKEGTNRPGTSCQVPCQLA